MFSSSLVIYAPDFCGLGLDMAKKCSREKALSSTGKGHKDSVPSYTECEGYAVCHIEEGIQGSVNHVTVLCSVTGGKILLEYRDDSTMLKV